MRHLRKVLNFLVLPTQLELNHFLCSWNVWNVLYDFAFLLKGQLFEIFVIFELQILEQDELPFGEIQKVCQISPGN